MNRVPASVSVLLVGLLLGGSGAWAAESVPRFGVFETVLTGPDKIDDPYRQVQVSVTFTGPAAAGSPVISTEAFWDGGTSWRVRISPTHLGQWTWRTSSATEKLNGLTGEFLCMPSRSVGFLRTSPATRPNLFLRADNPVFLLGTGGSVLSDFKLTDGSFQAGVDTRLTQGFNCLYYCPVNALQANEAGQPFTDAKRLTPNPAFFQAADQRLYYCRLRGMTVALGIDPAAKVPAEELERLWRHIVARYAAFDVIWVFPGSLEDATSPMRSLAELTHKLDPYQHPILGQIPPADQALARQDWLDAFIAVGDDPKTVEALGAFGKPVVSVPSMSEDLTGKAAGDDSKLAGDINLMRRTAWTLAMNGAHPVYQGIGLDPTKPLTLNSPLALQFSALGGFFRQTDWPPLSLQPTLLLKGEALVRARPGIEYVAYLPAGGTITLDVSAVTENFWMQWFNPRTGKVASSLQLPPRRELSAQSPDESGDWVLYVCRIRPRTER